MIRNIYTRRTLQNFSRKKYQDALCNVKQFKDHENDIWNLSNIILDIGFGSGEVTYHRLMHEKEINIIGCEVFLSGIIKLVNKISYTHERLFIYDGLIEDIIYNIPDNIIQEVVILFPDPWHKARHQKRRLINQEFVKQLFRITTRVIVATDNEDYFLQIKNIMSQYFNLSSVQDHFSTWPKTKYALKALNELKYMLWTK